MQFGIETNIGVDLFDELGPLSGLFNPASRIFWFYLLTAFTIALAVYIVQEKKRNAPSVLKYLFPKEILLHRSAIVDYFYFIINSVIFFLFLGPLMLSTNWVAERSQEIFESLGAPAGLLEISPWIVSAALLVAMDLALYLAHYLSHKIPTLWEFHKIHHSAEVLTPITVFRMHPVDDILNMTLSALSVGVTAGFLEQIGVGPLSLYLVSGVNVFLVAYYVFGYNLRHSHIWLSYGSILSRVLISPAQHQIHHSSLSRHWDKNFGFIFSLWDWFFGTLYVPQTKENFPLGIGGEEKEYSSVWRLYELPFVKSFKRLFSSRINK
ncbi:sterol desaturase family protein [bacterium]|nr:sterol desaturase family protein [bacterium]